MQVGQPNADPGEKGRFEIAAKREGAAGGLGAALILER